MIIKPQKKLSRTSVEKFSDAAQEEQKYPSTKPLESILENPIEPQILVDDLRDAQLWASSSSHPNQQDSVY